MTSLHEHPPVSIGERYTGSHAQRLCDGAACLRAALEYLERGWSPLALCPPDHMGVGKEHGKNCISPGKAPWGPWKRYQEQRPSAEDLRRKWRDNPTLNVGMALGPVSDLVRVDVDGPGGEARLHDLSGGDLTPTLEFTSGRANGGRGLLYRIPEGVALRTTSQSPNAGEELRFQAKGAQTVLPPSRHHSGTRYSWTPGHGPSEIEAAIMPAWLIDQLRAAGTRTTAKARTLTDGEVIHQATRNETLTSLAGTMRRRGMSEAAILAALAVVNEQQCDPPLPEDEVVAIARSVARYEPVSAPASRPAAVGPSRRKVHKTSYVRFAVRV
jgi:putative DNA primase/helicase